MGRPVTGLFLAVMTVIAFGSAIAVLSLALSLSAYPRDLDGHYAQSDPAMHAWFDKLANKHGGLCCSFTDGLSLKDVDWDTKDGHFRVRIADQWYDVPDDAVVTEPNRFGSAVVWPWKDWEDGHEVWRIRCFMPGAGA